MTKNPAVDREPMSTPTDETPIVDLVVEDFLARAEMGKEKYGTYLQASNGRDPMVDLLQELMDAVMYCRQELQRRKLGPEAEAGLYRKYTIRKANGSPVDQNAEYIVLRVDGGEYVEECRHAVAAFAYSMSTKNLVLSRDIYLLLNRTGTDRFAFISPSSGWVPDMPRLGDDE